MQNSKLEMGGSLFTLAEMARKWFVENNVEVPKTSKEWASRSVNRGEIPQGTAVMTLRNSYGITPIVFLNILNGKDPEVNKYKQNQITPDNSQELIGLEIIDTEYRNDNVHKISRTKCCQCGFEETLDNGTFGRMLASKNKYCRICRGASGKEKPLFIFDRFKNFIPIKQTANKKILYRCITCDNNILRGTGYSLQAEYLVCEHCNPKIISGAKLETPEGVFDSKIEYLAYLKLVEILPDTFSIERQKSYDSLFGTKTKHTADFYLPELDLVLEVTTNSNNLGAKYSKTMLWKLGISSKVKLALSVKEVEDIVRPLLKNKGITVNHSRSLCSLCPIRRQETSRSF